jgi:hypothetical protein
MKFQYEALPLEDRSSTFLRLLRNYEYSHVFRLGTCDGIGRAVIAGIIAKVCDSYRMEAFHTVMKRATSLTPDAGFALDRGVIRIVRCMPCGL